RLLSEHSVELMTTNHLTPEQMTSAGMLLSQRGWGFGVSVATEPQTDWPVPGRYGWSGGYGTTWFNDPHRGIVAIALTQVSDFMWNGGLEEFESSSRRYSARLTSSRGGQRAGRFSAR